MNGLDKWLYDNLAVDAATKKSIESQLPGRIGGPADAYRHLIWSAELTRLYGENAARAMLEAKEKYGSMAGQPKDQEDMDRHNNELGIKLGKEAKTFNDVVRAAQQTIDGSRSDVSSDLPNGKGATWLSRDKWLNNPKDGDGKELDKDRWNWKRGVDWQNGIVKEPFHHPKAGEEHRYDSGEIQPPATEPQLEAEPQPQSEKQAALGADGQTFLERIGQPNARPALDIAAKEPEHWTKEEADSVIRHYQRFSRPESLNAWLRDRTSEYFKHVYGKPGITPPYVPSPDPRAMQKALEQLGGKLAPAFDADGMTNATRSMQQGLNLLNQGKMPRLKEDGDWGPITDFGFKKSVANHGAAKLDEGFALGRLQTLAEKPQFPEDLAKQTQGIFGPFYGSQQTGNDHAVALQAGLNAIGPKYQDDWQPLKLDGKIGPKTTDAFNSLVHNAGPMALSEGIGSFLGWLE